MKNLVGNIFILLLCVGGVVILGIAYFPMMIDMCISLLSWIKLMMHGTWYQCAYIYGVIFTFCTLNFYIFTKVISSDDQKERTDLLIGGAFGSGLMSFLWIISVPVLIKQWLNDEL